MPSIDYRGCYRADAVATGKDTLVAIGFPVRASSAGVARRFADRSILRLLPGWTVGRVALRKRGKLIDSYVLRRPAPSAGKEE